MNKADGFITLHRKMQEWEWYKDSNTKSLFIHLLFSANFKDTRFEGKKIKRGQVVTSLNSLSNETGMSIQEIKTALKHLISTNEVTNQSTSQYRIITVVKYNDYQSLTSEITNDQQTTNKQPTNDQQYQNNDNNVNKETIKKESKRKTQPFIPPTLEEVREYCEERNNGIDPEYFFDYQEARNWTLKGGQKIKNWKAVIRTWEKTQKGDGYGFKPSSGADSGKSKSKYAELDASIPVF